MELRLIHPIRALLVAAALLCGPISATHGQEIRALAPPPKPYVAVKELGKGAFGIAYLVRSTEDGQLRTWKIPAEPDAHTTTFNNEVEALRVIRERIGNRVEAEWDAKRTGLLKTYIEGTTLHDYIESGRMFGPGPDASRERAALLSLLGRLAGQKIFIQDVNARNLIWDGEAWQIIDPGKLFWAKSAESALADYRTSILYKWPYEFSQEVETRVAEFREEIVIEYPPGFFARLWARFVGSSETTPAPVAVPVTDASRLGCIAGAVAN